MMTNSDWWAPGEAEAPGETTILNNLRCHIIRYSQQSPPSSPGILTQRFARISQTKSSNKESRFQFSTLSIIKSQLVASSHHLLSYVKQLELAFRKVALAQPCLFEVWKLINNLHQGLSEGLITTNRFLKFSIYGTKGTWIWL